MKFLKVSVDPRGYFHARPSSEIAAAAKRFESVIMITAGVDAADGKNPIALMRLGHVKDPMLEVMADGADEDQAIAEVSSVLQKALNNIQK